MDKKISELTSLSTPASDDLLPIVDVSTSETKKITVGAIIGDKYVRTTRFAIISSGTSGTVTIPPNSEVVLDDFGGTVDAVVSQVSGGFPTLISAKSSSGTVIATSFNSAGNWAFTGTPSAYPVAILYRVRQKLLDFDSTASDIWGNSNVEQVTEFVDSSFRIQDNSDPTKQIAFEAGSISSGQTRTLTAPNQNGIIALAEDALVSDRVLVSSATGKVNDSVFLKVDEDLDKKELTIGEDATYDYGAAIDAPADDGSAIEYDSTYAYPATVEWHDMEVFQYWNLNGVDVVSLFGSGYFNVESDGSDNYQIQWAWDDNVAPDGYFLVKYDSSPNSGLYYANVVGNVKNFLEDFTDWSTLNPYSGFNYNPTAFDYGTGNAYPADTQYHFIEVRAFKYVSGNKIWCNSQGFDGTADGSDDYNIQWAWPPIPGAEGYTVTKYDDTWAGEYSVDVSTNSFLEDFTDWSTKIPTPTFVVSVTETQYSVSSYSNLKATSNNVERTLMDFDGPIIDGLSEEVIVVGDSGGHLRSSSYRIVDPGIITTDGNFELMSAGIGGSATFRSGYSQNNVGSPSGNFLLETRNAETRTTNPNPPPTNGSATYRTGNGSTNVSAGTYVTGGQAGQVEIRGGIGGGAQNGTLNNQGAQGGIINIVSGKGGDTVGPGGIGGAGAVYQMATGAGGNCASSAAGQSAVAGNGGVFLAYANNGGQLTNINGTTGNAGDMQFFTGIAWPSNYVGSASLNRGGRGGDVSFRASAGGDASNSTVSNIGGRAGKMDFEVQRGGDGNTTQGDSGSITFRVGRPGKNSTDTAQGATGNIIFQPSPAAYTGAAEGVVGLATTTGGTKTGRVAIGHIAPSALLDVSGDTKLGTSGTVFQSVVSATATLDFPNISNNHIQELTMTVTGAQVGGSVHLGAPSTLEANLIAFGFVSATNTVTIRLAHMGGSGLNPASATWRATVFNF